MPTPRDGYRGRSVPPPTTPICCRVGREDGPHAHHGGADGYGSHRGQLESQPNQRPIGGKFSKTLHTPFQELLAGLKAEHERQVSTLKAENASLRQQVAALQSDDPERRSAAVSLAISASSPQSPVKRLDLSEVGEDGGLSLEDGGSLAARTLQQTMVELKESMVVLKDKLDNQGRRSVKSNASLPRKSQAPMKGQKSEDKDRSYYMKTATSSAGATQTRMLEQKTMTWDERICWFLENEKVEMAILILILANTVVMAFEMQYQGLEVGFEIGYADVQRSAEETWPSAGTVFAAMGAAFNVIFTAEVVTKIIFLRRKYLRQPLNWLDIFAVVVGLIEIVMVSLCDDPQGECDSFGNPMVVRLLRLAKLERGLRMMKMSKVLDNLSLLLKCLAASVTTLFWSLCLLVVIQCIAGMILSQMVKEYMLDPREPATLRQEVYAYYGTFTRSMLTMFEVTLANWAPACRVLVDNISEWYSAFFLFYRCVVGFAVLGVITAVFIQQTMQTASRDNEIMVKQKKKEQDDYSRKLQSMFKRMDTSGDGLLSYDEFSEMLADKTMKTWMSAMDIEPHDLNELFGLIVNDDGEVSFEQFLDGATRLRGGAKSFDMVRLLTMTKRLETKLDALR